MHLSFASRSLPLYCINNQHDFTGWGEYQRIMLHDKTWFLTLALCWKMVPSLLMSVVCQTTKMHSYKMRRATVTLKPLSPLPARNRGRRAGGAALARCSSCTSSRWSALDAETLSSSPEPAPPGSRPSRRGQTGSTPEHRIVSVQQHYSV